MHHLDRQLASWKESITRAGTLTVNDIAELETHVRDSVQQLTARGLTQEEAFLVALRRIGDPSVLAVEYQKVNPGLAWARRWYWMTAGLLGFSVVLQGIEVLSYMTAWLALPKGAAVAGLLIVGLGSYAALAVSMLRSATVPAGRLARLLQRAATWIERHPFTTGVVGFASLVGLRVANGLAKGAVWGGVDQTALTLAGLSVLVAVGMPILLFLLGWYVNPPAEPERVGNAG